MKKIFLLFVAIISSIAGYSQSGVQVLENSLTKLKNAKGISCDFTLNADGNTVKGTLKSTGKKFVIQTPMGTTWYDGKSMWTSNAATHEITLVTPQASEVAEANPLAYMHGNTSQYAIGLSSRTDANSYLVLLNPKQKNSQIKAVEISVNKKSKLPSRIIVRDRNDRRSTLTVTRINTSSSFPASTFVCPVASMKGYELVDLR